MSLKENWKSTGSQLGHAFMDLGKTLIKTAKTGIQKADEWANTEDEAAASAQAEQTEASATAVVSDEEIK